MFTLTSPISVFRFIRCNPQSVSAHPKYLASVVSQCTGGRVVCHVDSYRLTSQAIRQAGFRKVGIRSSGNGIIIQVSHV